MKTNRLKRVALIAALLFLSACGQPSKDCQSREAMILRCQAEELAGLHFPTSWQINQALIQCRRLYPQNKCY